MTFFQVHHVKILLEYGANANLVEDIMFYDGTKEKESMLTCAIVDAKSKDMVALLIKHGATWKNIITYRGITRVEKRFPYNRFVSADFVKFLKTQGWTGSLFG